MPLTPDWRRRSTASSVVSSLWMRFTALWTTGSKLCTPRLARLTPAPPKAPAISIVSVRGSISTAISRSRPKRSEEIRQCYEIRWRDDGGGTAAEVYPVDMKWLRRLRGDHLDLVAKQIQIFNDGLIFGRDGGVAAAIPAHRAAEGDMQVEGGRSASRQVRQPVCIGVDVDRRRELRRRWVAGIARQARLTIFLQNRQFHALPRLR